MGKSMTLFEEILKAAKECGGYTHLNGDISFTPQELAAFASRIRLEVLDQSRVAHLAVVETVRAAVNPPRHPDNIPLIRKRV
jgi:hypothetical protein